MSDRTRLLTRERFKLPLGAPTRVDLVQGARGEHKHSSFAFEIREARVGVIVRDERAGVAAPPPPSADVPLAEVVASTEVTVLAEPQSPEDKV